MTDTQNASGEILNTVFMNAYERKLLIAVMSSVLKQNITVLPF